MVGRKGAEVIQFRATSDLRRALESYAEANGFESASAAARVLLLQVLSDDENEGLRSLVAETAWSSSAKIRQAMEDELPGLMDRITERVLGR